MIVEGVEINQLAWLNSTSFNFADAPRYAQKHQCFQVIRLLKVVAHRSSKPIRHQIFDVFAR